MQTAVECLVCLLKQTIQTTRLSSSEPRLQQRIVSAGAGLLSQMVPELSPAENSVLLYRHVARESGVADPYAQAKQQANAQALRQLPFLEHKVAEAEDPLLTAVKIVIGGNVLDDGAQQRLGLEETLASCLERALAIDAYASFRELVLAAGAEGAPVLYLADNAGEICLDALLVRQLLDHGCRVTVVVRGKPIINDATLADARVAGLDRLCPVLDNGVDYPGTVLAQSRPEVQELFAKARLVVAKGMGNFETLSAVSAPIFFLFTVKCTVVRDHLRQSFPGDDVDIGVPVLVRGPIGAQALV